MQKTFAMIKPDAVERNLIGKILNTKILRSTDFALEASI